MSMRSVNLGEKLRELLYKNDMNMDKVNATIERIHSQESLADPYIYIYIYYDYIYIYYRFDIQDIQTHTYLYIYIYMPVYIHAKKEN